MSTYADSSVLVSTDWVNENLANPKIKLVEVNVDPKVYDAGHIPGAVTFSWVTQLQDQLARDVISKDNFEKLVSSAGIKADDTVVIYGDNNNWFAAYGFWIFKLYGHKDVRLINGGRSKWLAESDKPLTPDKPSPTPTTYRVEAVNHALRAKLPDILAIVAANSHNLIDVRSPDEFSGKVIAPPGMSETAQRAGHIPGAKSVPWSQTVNPDGTFKAADDLRTLYKAAGLIEDKPAVAYCRIGERSSHSWFVLKYLLGLKDVCNYDGSWTEYGNVVGVPIEKNV
jgi:thiosulfate/3-mercaptopyruvate sulfurtransferase